MSTVDVDLNLLASRPKTVALGEKVYKLPGDMPMELFFKTEQFQQRVDAGEDEAKLVHELADEILGLFQVHQPKLAKLPTELGLIQLFRLLGQVYGGGDAAGEAPAANRATRRASQRPRTRTPSSR